MDGVDDLARVDSLEVDRGDPEVRVLDMRVMWEPGQRSRGGPRRSWFSSGAGCAVGAQRRSPEGGRSGAPTACASSGLPLDDRQRDAFVRHLDRVSMPQLGAARTAAGHQPAPRAGAARRGRLSLSSRGRESGRRGCTTADRSATARGARSSERHAPSPSRPSRPSFASRPYRRGPTPTPSSGPDRTRRAQRLADPQPPRATGLRSAHASGPHTNTARPRASPG